MVSKRKKKKAALDSAICQLNGIKLEEVLASWSLTVFLSVRWVVLSAHGVVVLNETITSLGRSLFPLLWVY
jgi:hypothetical protein